MSEIAFALLLRSVRVHQSRIGATSGVLELPGSAAVAQGCRGVGQPYASGAGRCRADVGGDDSATRCCLPKGRLYDTWQCYSDICAARQCGRLP